MGCRNRGIARAKLADVEGALADFDRSIEKESTAFALQERGVLKRMMGDLRGALADLHEALASLPDDYEVLKHRGFVRFLMTDEKGARSDAVTALAKKPRTGDRPRYGSFCLGTTSVEFLDFKLR